MTTATIDLAIAGSVGCAERTDLATAEHDPRIVDVWTLHPRVGGEPTMLTVQREGTSYGLAVVSVFSWAGRMVALPVELAYDLHLAGRLPVHTDGEARQVAAALARQTTNGTLPHRPATDGQRQTWRAVITALATVAADDTGGFQPGVATVEEGAT